LKETRELWFDLMIRRNNNVLYYTEGGLAAETGGGASQEDSAETMLPNVVIAVPNVIISDSNAIAADSRKCSACGVSVEEWKTHCTSAQHKERVCGRVRSVLERGLEIKQLTNEMGER
jgi:hypothetical protein